MSDIKIDILTVADLDTLEPLQPPTWPDIKPHIKFYIESKFCIQIKAIQESEIVGIGAAILFENTSWLAHIIVNPNFRKKGIGRLIVEHLLEMVKAKKIETALLIATALGEPIYTNAGFKKITDYIFLKKENEIPQFPLHKNVTSYISNFKNQILKLDFEIMGEKRAPIITDHFNDAFLFIENNKLQGYYLPTLGEGSVIAASEQAGLELLKLRCLTSDRIVIPKDNTAAFNFLIKNGYKETSRCTKMFLGKPITWQPQNYYSRIGGYLG